MITFFHNFANTWGAKFIFVLLTVCMIVWFGVGSFYGKNPLRADAIQVGSGSVSIQELTRLFETERQKLSGLTGGRYISPRQALEAGLLLQVVQQQINRLLNEQIQNELGLTASNAAVQKYVERNPVFADATGRFDRNLFYAYLTHTRMTEAQLAQELQKELASQHLTQTISKGGYAPDELVRLIYKTQNEKRDVTALFIATDSIQIPDKPSEETLRDLYEAEAENLMVPEYRGLTVVVLTPEDMLSRILVGEEEIEAAYEEQQTRFDIPEKRRVYQMRFETKEAAEEAVQAVTPDTFEQVAAQTAGQTAEQTAFGLVAKNELIDELADPVFSARAGEILGPVESPLGWHVLLVREVQAEQKTPMAQAKKEIARQLALDKTYDMLYETARQLEDVLGMGTSLKEAAQQLGLSVSVVPAVDVGGALRGGGELDEKLNNKELLQSVFTLQKGDVSALVEHKNGYIVAEVTDVIPVSQQSFAEAKEALVHLWRSEQQKERLPQVVQNVLTQAQKGVRLEVAAPFSNGKWLYEKEVTRKTPGQLPGVVMNGLHHQEAGVEHAASVPVSNGTWIFATNKITPAPDDPKSAAYQLAHQALKTETGEELVQDVMSAYAQQFGIKINEQDIEKAFSVYRSEE